MRGSLSGWIYAATIAATQLMGGIPVSANDVPGILPIPHSLAMTEKGTYPPQALIGNFNGEHERVVVTKSEVHSGNRVVIWQSKAGALKVENYPRDEFVYVLEGQLVTIDKNQTRREFKPGDTFVIPKGWAGVWEMKTDFKKIYVHY